MMRLVPLLLIGALTLTACAQLAPSRVVVARQYRLAVTLEEQSTADASAPLAHPCALDPAVLKTLMARLRYQGKAGLVHERTTLPVFQDDEIERLAPLLTQALARAGQDQYVRFVSFSQGKGVFFNKSQKSEGIMFVTSGHTLNLAFNYINAKRSPSETSALYHEYSKLNPLRITTTATPLVLSSAGVRLQALADNQPAPMWLVADMKMLEKGLATAAAPVAPTAAPRPEMKTAGVSVVGGEAEIAAAAAETEQQKRQSIKEKLRFLKALFKEGLISQEEYNGQKTEILNQL